MVHWQAPWLRTSNCQVKLELWLPRLSLATDPMAEGSTMSSWATYNYALSAEEVAVLSGIPTELDCDAPTEAGAYKVSVAIVDDNFKGSITTAMAILQVPQSKLLT